MSRFLRKEKRKQERGITLIALITTIIVLLILAGITIGAIIGSNGIIGQAQSAKEETEISQEKEIIDISTVEAMGKNNRGNLEEEEFQNAIDKHTNGRASVSDTGEEFEVFFEESNRYYTVDKAGNILGQIDAIEDEYAGDITKNGEYDGTTLEKAYRINCIEDLVDFSNMSKTNDFENLYVVLTRDLNFSSPLSYNDYLSTEFGNINGDNETDGIMQELTTGTGFTPIGARAFKGTFTTDTERVYTIKNIYENKEGDAGLFYSTENAKIENIGITGNITSTTSDAGGIICVDTGGTLINNCYNEAKLVAENTNSINSGTGGVIGALSTTGVVNNCYNKGSVKGNASVGGIVGHSAGKISNSYNFGEIMSSETKTYTGTGGIAGKSMDSTDVKIVNCYNTGKISGQKNSGGIIGYIRSRATENIKIVNCYNLADIVSGDVAGGIIGSLYNASANSTIDCEVINCYNIGKIQGIRIGGIIGQVWQITNSSLKQYITNCFNGGKIAEDATFYGEFIGRNVSATVLELSNCYYISSSTNNIIGSGTVTGTAEAVDIDENLISMLNEYVEEYNNKNKGNADYEELKKWKLDDNDGYPTLEE